MWRILGIVALLASLGACADRQQASRQPSLRSSSPAASFSSEVARQCLADLGARQANFTPLPDQYRGQGCTTLSSVRLDRLRGDISTLELANLGPVTCSAANTFAAWARYGVDRAAWQILGSRLLRIETMGSYACRNVAGTARRSGHATANAIDVSAFVLTDGRRISVVDGWNAGEAERQFLRIVHQSACKRFGTVLGPDYNSAHRDHLHLEADGASYCR